MIYRSSINVADREQQTTKLKNHQGVVVIFGTGNYGTLALHALKKQGMNVHFFCDNNRANWGKQINGLTVLSPDELLTFQPDSMVFIAHLQFRHMADQLRSEQRIQIMHCDFLFSELDLSGVVAPVSFERHFWMLDLYMFARDAERDPRKLNIKSLDVVVTEKCTLRCKDCSNLMQFYKSPHDSDFDLLLHSLDRFMGCIDELHEARVIGGEPFLYQQMPHILERLVSYRNCQKVTIFTNGTMVPKETVLDSLRHDKVSLIISDYGKLSKKVIDLKAALNKHAIPFIAYEIDAWQDCASIYDRKRTDDELTALFNSCCVNDALTLLHGKLYACPFAAHAVNLKAVPLAFDDGIDLMAEDLPLLRSKIRELYAENKFVKACAFCAGRDYDVGKTKAAIQAKNPLCFERY